MFLSAGIDLDQPCWGHPLVKSTDDTTAIGDVDLPLRVHVIRQTDRFESDVRHTSLMYILMGFPNTPGPREMRFG